jgi:glycosyltransferase involved in cell wall biosynthesis
MDNVPLVEESAASEVRLTIAYSTLASRAAHIELPAMRADQEVLIIVQNPDGVAHLAPPERQDVRVLHLEGTGVAKSRNAAIANAQGKYLVFADDDIVFDLDSLDTITGHFEKCECSLVLGQAVDPQGVLRKKYPTEVQWLNRFNSGRAATYEMVIRVADIDNEDIRFDENFGAGATNYLGDEYIFIADMVKRGLKAHFLPITMATHPTESSGSGWGTREDLRARSVIFSRVFGPLAFVMRAAFIVRHRDKVSGLGDYVRFTLGAFR